MGAAHVLGACDARTTLEHMSLLKMKSICIGTGRGNKLGVGSERANGNEKDEGGLACEQKHKDKRSRWPLVGACTRGHSERAHRHADAQSSPRAHT